jgi:hypothetical protein
VSIGLGKEPVRFVCRGCGAAHRQRKSFYESRVGTQYHDMCLDCGAKVDGYIASIEVDMLGRITVLRNNE